MNQSREIKEVISILRDEMDLDGETMQYILEQVGMDEQMAIQLTTKYPTVVAEHLHELKIEGLI
jgi:hypothetical protein